MQTNKINIIAGVGIVLAIVFGVAYLKPTLVQNIVNVPEQEQVSLGRSAGPDRTDPCESINGIETCYNSVGLNTATTTFCSIRSPQSATSTLISGGVVLFTSSTSPMIVDIGRGTVQNSTTTERLTGTAFRLGSSSQAVIYASTTGEKISFAPGQWFSVMASIDGPASSIHGANGTFSPTGRCHAAFEVYK